jgi:hypothetical protein
MQKEIGERVERLVLKFRKRRVGVRCQRRHVTGRAAHRSKRRQSGLK